MRGRERTRNKKLEVWQYKQQLVFSWLDQSPRQRRQHHHGSDTAPLSIDHHQHRPPVKFFLTSSVSF